MPHWISEMGPTPTPTVTLATLIPIITGVVGATGGLGTLLNAGRSLLGGFWRRRRKAEISGPLPLRRVRSGELQCRSRRQTWALGRVARMHNELCCGGQSVP